MPQPIFPAVPPPGPVTAPGKDPSEALGALERLLLRHKVLTLEEAQAAARLITGDPNVVFPPAAPPKPAPTRGPPAVQAAQPAPEAPAAEPAPNEGQAPPTDGA